MRWFKAAFIVAVLLVPTVGPAQSSIAGQVKDASGTALSGVTVEVSREIDERDEHAVHLLQRALAGGGVGAHALMKHARTVVTDSQGLYRIFDVRPGTYTAVYRSPRFRTLRREGIEVQGNHVVPINVELAGGNFAQASAPSIVEDYYSPIVEWQQASGLGVAPIHVSLLPSGVLFFMEPFFGMVPTPNNVPTPASIQVLPMLSPLPGVTYDPTTGIQAGKMLSCGGHALMADGNVFFSGGTYVHWNVNNPGRPPEGAIIEGISDSRTYNTVSNTWITNPDSIGVGTAAGRPVRWYPTVTRLADSRILLTGGYETVFPAMGHNRSVDVFDPVNKTWSATSNFSDTPEGIANPDYTHVYQFPTAYVENGINREVVMMLGGSAEPLLLFMNGQESVWQPSGKPRPGVMAYIKNSAPSKVHPNYTSSSAMLPIRLPEDSWGYTNGSVINIGGDHVSPMARNIDIYDPGLNAWKPSVPMSGIRHYSTATILPDGRIVILAGHAPTGAVDQTGYAEYVDPKNNFAHSVGSAHMPEVRGYHSMVILLPDGRVFVGGGNDDGNVGTEKSHFRYYYPDYMFKKRPEIVFAEGTIKINNYFPVIVPHSTSVDEISLLALGSMTHSIDMGQRSVQLRLHSEHFTVKKGANDYFVPANPSECSRDGVKCYDKYLVQAPTTRELASPGHYMLFVLDENRVPSRAKIVKLEP